MRLEYSTSKGLNYCNVREPFIPFKNLPLRSYGPKNSESIDKNKQCVKFSRKKNMIT
jgi:hypothetical protein